jgi:hypothetical protein
MALPFDQQKTQSGNSIFENIYAYGSIETPKIVKSGGTSSQFLKADGSIDSTTYASANTFNGTLNNILTLNTSGTGLSGIATYNNASAVTFTVTSNATSSNTGGAIVARDGSGNFSAGTITATDFNSTSDINLKTNIKLILSPLSKLLQLNGITFNWKKDNRPSVGVIAQEVEKVFPELVNETENFKTVNYDGLIGLLIEAIKEQQQQIDELKKQVNK